MKLHHSGWLPLAAAALTPTILPATAAPAGIPDVRISVQADRPGPAISPVMYGVFFEDINFGGDGGLYPERVKNRSFEFSDPMMGWAAGPGGRCEVRGEGGLNESNPHYLRVMTERPGASVVLVNEGYAGMGVEAGAEFTFSVHGRVVGGGQPEVVAAIESADGRVLGQGSLKGFGTGWGRLSCAVSATRTDPRAKLRVTVKGPGTLDLDMVSLFPQDTWMARPNGLRRDLVQMLADLKPAFLRFPGGCIVEGSDLSKRYQWKTTIGPIEERRNLINRWNYEFRHRPTPDYYQSFGLGFFEYFQLSEDLGAEPMPILNCGMACQFNTGELVPLDELDPYIQDALDLVEFARGPADSPWGSRRAAMGHPAPFSLKYLGIGNEQWGPQYLERYDRFAAVLKEKYPDLTLVAAVGPSPEDDRFKFLSEQFRVRRADVVDEHCYAAPSWFLNQSRRYDDYDRAGPKVFMGEYAAQSVGIARPDNRNTWECALAEAAYIIGMERNADVVVMSSYAPLSGHVERWQWTPNLMWFDNLRVYPTPNYFVQQLFSRHKGDVLLPTELGDSVPMAEGQPRFYAAASLHRGTGELILKVVNATAAPQTAEIRIDGAKAVAPQASVTLLTSSELTDVNSLEQPRKVAPVSSLRRNVGPLFGHTFPRQSFTILRIGLDR